MLHFLYEVLVRLHDVYLSLPAVRDLIDMMPTLYLWGIRFPQLHFDYPWIASFGLVAAPILVLLFNRRQASLGHSRLPQLKRKRLAALVPTLRLVFLGTVFVGLSTAIAVPNKVEPSSQSTAKTVDVLIYIDISTNVVEPIPAYEPSYNGYGSYPGGSGDAPYTVTKKALNPPEGTCGAITDWGERKLDDSAWAACKIVEGLPVDRITVGWFDGGAHCCTPPLVLDHKFVDRTIRGINQQVGDGNSNFDGPYPVGAEGPGMFQTALDYLAQDGTSDSKVLVVITDGDGTIAPNRYQDFATRLQEMHVHLFMLGPGGDTVADDPDTIDIVKFTRDPKVNGVIIDCSSPDQVQQVIDQIKAIPPSTVKLDSKTEERPVFDAFLLVALIGCVGFGITSAVLGRIR
jgi:hypothetical protein